MKNALATSVPLTSPLEIAQRRKGRAVFLISVAAALFLLCLNTLHREFYSGDEGFYGVTALNMLHSPNYLVEPSYFPEGDFRVERDAYAHPPFNSYFYALSLWFSKGSLVGPEVVNFLFFILLLYFAYQVAAQFNNDAARYTTLLLAASPAILLSYSQLEAEPLMTTFGIISLFCALQTGPRPWRQPWLFFSGICLGFAYALKLWLCGPLALAVAVALYFRFRQWEGTVGQKLLALVPFIVAVLAPAGLHLLVIGWTHPEDLAFWLKNIYFGVFASAGISGSKLAGAGVATNWVHPFWYYAPALYRDHFFLTPILVLGLFPALRDRRFPRQFLWIIGAGLAGLLPLSLIKVKEPLYVLSCSIFLYFLAGLCLSALTRRISARGGLDPLSFKVGMVMSIGLLVLFPLAYVKGIQPDKITKGFVIVHSVSYLLFLAVLLWSRFKVNAVFFERSIYALCAAAILVSFGYDSTTRPPRDKAIASLLRPYLQANPPNALSMIASNFKSYQFYSFHKGCYWHELSLKDGPETVLAAPQFEQVRAFVLDPDDQHRAEMASWITWLESHASEKTSELDARLGKPTGFRVFVRDSAQHAAR